MLSIADRIAAVNEQELTAGDRQLSEMFVSLRTRLVVVFSVAVLVGLLQAAFSMRRILRLERATERHLEDGDGGARAVAGTVGAAGGGPGERA